ncbi:MAG: hypothetical protein P4L90_21525 [Rhodopila sp.]|nr:hypothetical protein [Rhodopila sp.]
MSTLVRLSDEELDAVTGGFLNFRDINVAVVSQSQANLSNFAFLSVQASRQSSTVIQVS